MLPSEKDKNVLNEIFCLGSGGFIFLVKFFEKYGACKFDICLTIYGLINTRTPAITERGACYAPNQNG